jgi:hypothetical protein
VSVYSATKRANELIAETYAHLFDIPMTGLRFMEWPAPPSGVVSSPANQEEEGMDISGLGVDLGKNVCSVVGLDASGAVMMRRKARRETLIALAEKLPPCFVELKSQDQLDMQTLHRSQTGWSGSGQL